MGGFGSGRQAGWGGRGTADAALRLDVRRLARSGALTLGLWRWVWRRDGKESSSLAVCIFERGPRPGRLRLSYQAQIGGGEWRAFAETVGLLWTPCHYGGARPWFACPGCGGRVAVLYAGDGRFRCRRCHGLAYESQREDDKNRALAMAQAIRLKLGGSANMLLPFPGKPPRMHWRTYWRLRQAARVSEAVYDVAVWAWLAKTDMWLNRRYAGVSHEREPS